MNPTDPAANNGGASTPTPESTPPATPPSQPDDSSSAPNPSMPSTDGMGAPAKKGPNKALLLVLVLVVVAAAAAYFFVM